MSEFIFLYYMQIYNEDSPRKKSVSCSYSMKYIKYSAIRKLRTLQSDEPKESTSCWADMISFFWFTVDTKSEGNRRELLAWMY